MEYIYSFLTDKNKIILQIFTSSLALIFFLFLFYLAFEITYGAFIKNYTTGTIWDPPLWIPYSSMFIGATVTVLQYIAEVIYLLKDLKKI